MKKFKTLKDVKSFVDYETKKKSGIYGIGALKDAAIEHFLHLDDLKRGKIPNTNNLGSELSWYWIDGQMNWIYHFFILDKKYEELLGQ